MLCCATYIAAAVAIAVSVINTTGGYFFNGLDALKHYPQWSEAFALAGKAGWPTGSAAADLTMFVPGESVMHHHVCLSMPLPIYSNQRSFKQVLCGAAHIVQLSGSAGWKGATSLLFQPPSN